MAELRHLGRGKKGVKNGSKLEERKEKKKNFDK